MTAAKATPCSPEVWVPCQHLAKVNRTIRLRISRSAASTSQIEEKLDLGLSTCFLATLALQAQIHPFQVAEEHAIGSDVEESEHST